MFKTYEELEKFHKGLDTLDTFKQKVLKAYELTNHNVKRACEIAEVSRASFYYWQKTDWVFAKQIEIYIEGQGDYVEMKLRELAYGRYKKKIEPDPDNPGMVRYVYDKDGNHILLDEYEIAPNASVLMFLAKTKHKDRGYIETIDNKLSPGDANSGFVIDWRTGIIDEKEETNV